MGPVSPVTVPKEALLNTVPNIMLPSTNIRLVIVVQNTTRANPYVDTSITVKRIEGIIAKTRTQIAIFLVVNLSVKYPQTGTDNPPRTFPKVNAPAAVFWKFLHLLEMGLLERVSLKSM